MSKHKIRYIFIYISLFVTLILQTTIVSELSLFGVVPSLILVTVICFSLINDYIPSAVFATVAGLLTDISGSRIIGFNALLMLYLALGVVYVGQEFLRDTPKAAIVLVLAGTFVYEMVYFIFGFAIFGGEHFFYIIARVILIECVYNAIVTLPIYFYISKFLKIRSGHSLLD